MAIIRCRYCEAEISSAQVEAEDGHCPECGAIITLGRSNFGDEEDEFDDLNTFEEDDEEFEEEDEDLFDDEDEDEED